MSADHARSHIYDTYTKSQRRGILASSGMIALITPFTDTIYLPTLVSISEDLNTSDAMVSLSVSLYLACVGIGQLVWGPLADKFGRLSILYPTLGCYMLVTIACIFSPSIGVLIALRSLQGFIVGSTIVIGSSLVADVFPPHERGSAMAAMFVPLLVGPIVAPIVGGILSEKFGWRSTFVLLAVLTVPAVLFSMATVPETHHWFLWKDLTSGAARVPTEDPESKGLEMVPVADGVEAELVEKEGGQESDTAVVAMVVDTTPESADGPPLHLPHLIPKPELLMPWESLRFISDLELTPYFVLMAVSFMCMFVSLILLPLRLAESPYDLNPALVGIAFLPVGFGMLIFAIVGGMMADLSAKRFSSCPQGMLIYPLCFSWLLVAGCIGFGITLEMKTNIAGPLITQTIIGAGQAVTMPGISGLLTIMRPDNAAGVSSASMFLMFVAGAIGVSFSVPIYSAIGFQNFQFILSAVAFLSIGYTAFVLKSKLHSSLPTVVP